MVAQCTVKDVHLRDELKKVWAISKEFDSLFMEFIPRDQNDHADRIANATLDKELQIQEVVSEYFDRSDAWPATPNKSTPISPVPISPVPAKGLTLFSNPKLRSVSPQAQHQHQNQNLNINKVNTSTAGSKPLSSALKRTPLKSANVVFPAGSMAKESRAKNPVLTRTVTKSLNGSKVSDSFWSEDLDILSISDESSITESEEESYFKQFMASCLPEISAHAAATTPKNVNIASDDTDSGDVENSENEQPSKSASSHRLCTSSTSVNAGLAPTHSAIQLSEADYDHLVTAVINRLKKSMEAED